MRDIPGHHNAQHPLGKRSGNRTGLPVSVGIFLTVAILLASAGATIFFVMKTSDDERLYRQGQHELAVGQYAFAVKTLERAAAMKPRNARIYLALARAYVGIDQIDKAWECVSQAQQLGAGVVSEPALASELANFYRQHQQWGRAVEMLRPLAQAGVPGKKAELADLDALWGDECLQSGNLEQALKCWEEVRAIGEGSRLTEVDSRLVTVYQRFANDCLSSNDDAKALDYLNRLNIIAPNAVNYEHVADIYDRQGQLELAIDQLRKAAQLGAKDPDLNKKLAALMLKRGKELLDKGDTQSGFGYIQEANSLNPALGIPAIALRNVIVSIAATSGFPNISGEVWNPGPNPESALTLKFDLCDSASGRVLWSRDEKVVDEFMPPLAVNDAKPFNVLAALPVKQNGLAEFRVYINGSLYKSYPFGIKAQTQSGGRPASPGAAPRPAERVPLPAPDLPSPQPAGGAAQPAAPNSVPSGALPSPSPAPSSQQKGAEDKTLKDLDQ